jgi:protein-S-isoprenylcysteine O-methyltransferase Ste14
MSRFFDYFQIASVAISLLIIVGRASYLGLSRNINPIAIGGGKKGFLLAAELTAFAGLAVWIAEVLLYALHSNLRIFPSPLDTHLLSSLPAQLIGVTLVTLGLVIFILAFASFGDSWRVGIDVKAPGALVTTGIFAASRNPIYVFLDLWFFGIFLINGTLIFLIFAVAAVAVLHWQILEEEDFLLRLYGQPYQNYCAKTGRYIRARGGRCL